MTDLPTLTIDDLADDDARYLLEQSSLGLLLVDGDGEPICRLLPLEPDVDDDEEPADVQLTAIDEGDLFDDSPEPEPDY